MPTQPPPDYVRQQRKEMLEELLKEGYAPVGRRSPRGSAVSEVGRRFGTPRSTMDSWLRWEEQEKASKRPSYLPDWSLFPEAKPKIKVPAGKKLPPDYVPDAEQKPTIRVRMERDDHQDYYIIAIGDAHDAPTIPDKSRFRHAGKFVAEMKPDMVVQIGDFFTFDSISQFAQPGSVEFKEGPTFPEDITSAQAALTAFSEGLDGYDCDLHVTAGNHEDRIWSHAGRNPQLGPMIQLEFDRLLARNSWTYSLFSQPYWVGGVAFSHIPLSIMGKPIGGELTTQNVALKAVTDWVYGHTHRSDVARRPKLGGFVNTAINLGSFLPTGHVEHYIKVGTLTGWSYCLFELRISKGRIQSYRQHTVDELREKYG
jgi:hypothetical protein